MKGKPRKVALSALALILLALGLGVWAIHFRPGRWSIRVLEQYFHHPTVRFFQSPEPNLPPPAAAALSDALDAWTPFADCARVVFGYNQRLMLKSLFKPIIDWYMGALANGGYALIALLMAIESSVLPLPSEVVIPPAAHLAHTGKIPLSLWGIVVAGTLGSWLGATMMYWAARAAGRPLVLRYGRYVFIKPEKLEGAERWAAHYGGMGIFISRLLPVVRHLIGIPAGIVRMDYRKFSLYTLLGSAIWCAVLCYLGVKMGQDEKLMAGELHRISLWLGGAMLVLGALYYFFVHRQMKPGAEALKR